MLDHIPPFGEEWAIKRWWNGWNEKNTSVVVSCLDTIPKDKIVAIFNGGIKNGHISKNLIHAQVNLEILAL